MLVEAVKGGERERGSMYIGLMKSTVFNHIFQLEEKGLLHSRREWLDMGVR